MSKRRFPFRNEQTEKESDLQAAVDMMRNFPTPALLQTIETIIKVLRDRGKEIRDFDHKEKVVQQVRMIGITPYFLAAKPEEDVGEYLSELQHMKENNRLLMKQILKLNQEKKELQEENCK